MGEPGDEASLSAARREAERLVVTGLAAVSAAAERIGAPTRQRGGAAAAGFDALGDVLFGPSPRQHRVANDSPECCHCPICRVIAAARRPDPAMAERLATGVGDLAEGTARLLRNLSGPASQAGPRHDHAGADEDPWTAATDPPPGGAPDR